MFRRSEKGFTLVELMIVVVIIGILASIAIPKFSSIISKAKTTEAKQTLNQIISYEAAYYYNNSAYVDFDNVDVPAIDFELPANAKFDYSFATDAADASLGVASAVENVDLNGDGDTDDGLTLDTDKTQDVINDLSW